MPSRHPALRPVRWFFPLLLATTTPLGAQTYWNSGTGDWTNGANWTNGIPVAGQLAAINNGGIVSLSNAQGEAGNLHVGISSSNGTLTIENGGTLTAMDFSLGTSAGTAGFMTVTGSNSSLSLNSNTYSYIGLRGTGALDILDGASVWSRSATIASGTAATGSVLISGSGSKWTVTSLFALDIGSVGQGSVTVREGGTLDVATGIVLGDEAGSKGTLKIGDGLTAGTIVAPSVSGGTGTAEVIFSQTDSSYTFAPNLEGSLKLTHSATGTTILTGTNTYTGITTINAGTLQIGNGGTSGTLGSGAVVNSGTLAFNRSDAITVSNVISGTGQLKMLGSGTLTLTGSNSYTGKTTISNGTLVMADDHALGPYAYPASVLVDGSNATLKVNSGINLTKAVQVENSGTVNNAGVISGTTSYLIYSFNTNLNVVNTGTISGGEYVIYSDADDTTGNKVRNTGGVITTTDPWGLAIYLNTHGDVTNEAGGIINGNVHAGEGLPGMTKILNTGSSTINGSVSFASGALTNTGGSTIAVTDPYDTAVMIDVGGKYVSDPSVTNSGSSVIRGGEYGIWATNSWMMSRAVINNTGGSIITSSTTSSGVAGIYMDSTMASAPGTVNNGVDSTIIGRTYGVYLSGGGSVTNDGIISKTLTTGTTAMGVRFAGDPGTLVNTGTINGGVRMDNYANSVTLKTGSVINGNLLMGTSSSSRLILGGTTGSQLYSTAVTGTTTTSGTLTKQDAGTWIIDNNLSTTRAVTITGGTLQIGNSGTTGAIGGSVSNAGTLDFNRSDTTTSSTAISGTGKLVQSGSGTLILTGTNTYSGGTTINSGTLQIGNGGTIGSLTGNVVDNGTLVFNRSNDLTFAGAISGTGSLIKSGTATLILTGSNTFTGVTTVGSGTLQIGNSGTTGSLTGNVINSGALVFKRSDSLTYSGAVSGTGSLTQSGTGTLILTGSNSYAGNTRIQSGTLQVGSGGTSGTLGSGAVLNSGALAFNRSDSLTVNNVISGSGSLTQSGSGTTILTATNTYTGATDVKAGTLRVNGALTSSTLVTIHNGGTLAGSGTIAGAVNVLSGGGISAGNSPGTLTLGSLTLNSGAVSTFELGTSSDLIAVTGNLTIGGVLNLSNSGGFSNTSYTLFTYGGALTNNYFELNLVPTGWNRANFVVDLSTAGAVKLTVDNTVTIQYWDGSQTSADGSISGGNGTWSNDGKNWTNSNASLNTEWQGVVGVFGGTGGTVSVADDVTFSQLQFDTDGYQLASGGGSLVTSGSFSELWIAEDVGTEVAASITGTSALRKTGAGALTLSASNSYSGGTVIANGTVHTENEHALGTGSVTLQSLGTLDLSSELTIGGDFIWEAGVIRQTIGGATTTIHVTGAFDNSGGGREFSISTGTGFAANTAYTLLTFGDGTAFTLDGLIATSFDGLTSEFRLINSGNTLQIIYLGAMTGPILQNSPDINTPLDRPFTVDGAVETGKESESNEVLSLIFADGGGSITVHNTLQLGSGAITTGTGNAAILDGKLASELGFTVDTDGDLTISSIIASGTGGLTKSGTGTLKLLGSNTYSGGTVINAGTVQTGNTQALGSGSVSLNADATLAPIGKLTISSFTWNGGVIAFSQGNVDTLEITGDLIKGTDAETFVFSLAGTGFQINKTYTLLSFCDNIGFALSDFQADTFYGITPVFAFEDNTLTIHYTGATSGPVLQNSAPVFTPLDANFLVSGTVTTQGPLESNTVNSLLFEDKSSLEVSNTLFVTSGNFTVIDGSAALTGDFVETPGDFHKLGRGILINGANLNVDGEAVIEDGGLIVNGRFTTDDGLVVNPDAFLGGSGVIGGTVVNYGILSPGNSPGTLTVTGNHAQTDSSVFLLEIAGKNDFDRLHVSGTASLAGSVVAIPYDGHRFDYGQKFTFVKAGKIVGEFDDVEILAGFRGRVVTGSQKATLLVAPESYMQVAQTPNQTATAKALDHYINAEGGDRETVSIALDELEASEFPNAFDQISPAFYETLGRITIEQSNAQGQMLQQRFGALRLGIGGFRQIGLDAPIITESRRVEGKGFKEFKETRSIMEPAADNPWGVWVQGNGLFAKNSGLNGIPNFRFDNGGFLLGADYRWNDTLATGIYAGYQRIDARYDGGSKTRVNAARFGAYATLDTGNGFYGNALLGGGFSDYEVRRRIDFGSIDRTARSNPQGGEFSAMLGTGYDWKAGNFTFGPVASGQYTYVNINDFTEEGARSLNLRINEQETHSLRSTLGARVAFSWLINENVALVPEGRITWQHEFLQDSRDIGAALDGGSGPGFNVVTMTPERDAVFAGVGLNLQVGQRWNANVYYNADFGRGDFKSQMISGGVKVQF